MDHERIAQSMRFSEDQRAAYDDLSPEDQAAFAEAISIGSDDLSNHHRAIYNRVMGAGVMGLPKAEMTTDEAFESAAMMYMPDFGDGEAEGTEEPTEWNKNPAYEPEGGWKENPLYEEPTDEAEGEQ